jgi:hypothetical protein
LPDARERHLRDPLNGAAATVLFSGFGLIVTLALA